MGIMSFLRNKAGLILVGFIGFAIVAFLLGDAVRLGSPFWSASQSVVGKVDGESIDINAFNARLEQNTNNFKQQMGQSSLSPEMASYVQESTWSQMMNQILNDKEFARLGFTVGKNELNDMITGKNPDPQIVQAFGDPATGTLNRTQLNSFLSNVDSQDPSSVVRQQWGNLLLALKESRMSQKYMNLVKNSLYVTSLEAREDYLERNKLATFSYIRLDYASIPNAQVKVTDDDYQDYYEANKYKFKNQEETRSIEYISFDATPSKADTAEVKAKVNQLAADFKATPNDSLFVSINSDTKAPITYIHKGQIDPALDSLVFSAAKGTVVGPVLSNGTYKIAKVIDSKVGPDSVQASHILINPATEGGLDKAKVKADSIANLIRKGASFSEMAAKFGTDASKDKGGDLGTFGRGAMIPAFEEPVFDGKTGDLKVVTTQYGVHIIRIGTQKGSSRVAKVATVDKAINSSSKTQQNAYSKVTAFLSSAKNAKDFDEQAAKSKYVKQLVENITASQNTINGLTSPREIVRWAFKADEGDVAEQVFELENEFVVAKLVSIREKGQISLDKVKKEIEPDVIKMVKARMLKDKFDKASGGASSINQIAQKVGKPVTAVQNVVFANPQLPGSSQESNVIGTAFGMQPNKVSKPIEGTDGVYVINLVSFSNPAPLSNTIKQKEQISQLLDQRAQNQVLKVLKDKADVTDNRNKFF